MKLRNIYIALIAVLLGGCSDDFLTREPLGQMTQEDFDKLSQSGGNAAVAEFDKLLRGAYDVFNFDEGQISGVSHHGEWMWDIITDDAQKGGDGAADYPSMLEWRKWSTLPSSGPQTTAYTVGYAGVVRANDVLKQLYAKKENITDTLQYNRLLGEALFIRGYFYFYLTKLFGSVPYIDTTELKEGQNYPQPQPKEMYQLIEKDLQQAVKLLPTKNQMKLNFGIKPDGRATKGAAQALLARVIMMEIGFGYNNKTWQEVYDLASDIIRSGQYALVGNYAQIFTLEGEQSVESVFEIDAKDFNQGWGGLGGNIQQIMCSPRLTVSKQNTGKNIVSGWGFQLPTQNLYDEFESGDPRLPNTIIKSGDIIYEDGISSTDEKIIIDPGTPQCPTGYFNRKAVLPPPGPSCNMCSNLNKRLIRYSEVLLTAAEAAYHLGKEAEAREYVNMIRDRARNSSGPKGSELGNPGYPNRNTNSAVLPPVTASGDALLAAIKHERRVELAMEGHRLWDLIRWGEYEDAIRRYVPEDVLISSISPDEVITNYRSHLIDGKVPTLPIPRNEVLNYGVKQNPGYPSN
jgi:hypothetical protein